MFVCGTIDGLIQISGRRHNTEDLIATVLAVEPHTFVYKGRGGEGGMMLELVWSVGYSHWSSLGRPSPIAQVKMNVSVQRLLNSTALHVFSHHIVSCVPCHSSVWCDCM